MAQEPDRFEEANRIFLEALTLPAAQRQAFVGQACHRDPDLHDSVLRLLSQFERVGSFLERPALGGAADLAQQLRIGQLLGDRFRIVEMLGRGGMGEVYRAEDTALNEVVAIKTVRLEWRHDPSMIARFRDELRLARSISHPNICRIFDLFTSRPLTGEEIVFFTMECLDGESLADRLGRGERLQRETILEIAQGIAAGLDAAADAGIVHRDLKPANILLVPNRLGTCRPVITDFGLAVQPEMGPGPHSATGVIAGSPHYMAPEQFLGEPLSSATDVFAFGLIVYEMATGQRPYPEESLMRMAIRRITEDAPRLRSVAPDAPRGWEQVLCRALARRPADRPKSAGEVVRGMRGASRRPFFAKPKYLELSRRTVLLGGSAGLGLSCFYAIWRFIERGSPVAPVIMVAPFTSADKPEDARSIGVQIEKGLLQSVHVSVVDSAKIRNAWELMGRKGPVPANLTGTDAREIAMRSGAGYVVFGDLHRSPDEWALELRLETMSSSPRYARDQETKHFYADSEEGLFPAAGKAVNWIRGVAGESPSHVNARSRAPQEVTTGSWEALREFTAAEEAWRSRPRVGEWAADQRAAAEAALTRALSLDPDFALAAGRLADIQISSGEYDKGLKNYEKAAKLIAVRNLKDREALRIRGLFAGDVGQFAKAEEVFEAYTIEYPQDGLGFFYRASMVHAQGRSAEALRLIEHAIRLAPNTSAAFYTNYAAWLLAAHRYAEAEEALERARKINAGDWTDQVQCALSFARFDAKAIEANLRHMSDSGSAAFRSKAFLLAACWRAELGRPSDAEASLRDGMRFDVETGQPVSARLTKIENLAKLYLRHGEASQALACCREMLAARPELRVSLEAGALLARGGDVTAARKCIPRGLPATPPEQTPTTLPRGAAPELMEWPIYWRRILHLWAELALAGGAPRTALRLVRDAPPGEYREEWPELLVRASLALGEKSDAQFWLSALASNPGAFWLWTEVVGPGFIREASSWAASLGSSAGDWTRLKRFLNEQ